MRPFSHEPSKSTHFLNDHSKTSNYEVETQKKNILNYA